MAELSRWRAAALAAVMLSGCGHLGYYAQAIRGHAQVMQAARPLEALLADPDTAPALRERLDRAAAIRDFASRHLALPDHGSYRSYADLGRPYVVWNVFAAPELAAELRTWCFPVAGCVNYRAYYQREDAEHAAAALREDGYETYVAGVVAYSTLGYFDDPLLNTFTDAGEERTARVIFHELAHQVVYLRGETTFNESFAVAVEEAAMCRWLAAAGDPDRLRRYVARRAHRDAVVALLADTRRQLTELYASAAPPARKRQDKAALFDELRRAYHLLKEHADPGGEVAGDLDVLLAGPLNNASLGAVGVYTALLPAFRALLAESRQVLPDFYRRVAVLAAADPATRDRTLQRAQARASTAAGPCPAQTNARPPVQRSRANQRREKTSGEPNFLLRISRSRPLL